MRPLVQGPKDVLAGLIYVAFGAVMLWVALGYRMGTASGMGPGYFPRVLAVTMIVLGLASLLRGFLVRGKTPGGIAWKALVLVLGAPVLFGLLLERAGLIVALITLVLVSAAASKAFRFDARALLGLLALIAFCVLTFVKGLGVPMPVLGSWLEPLAVLVPWLR